MARPPIRINKVASGQDVMERISQDAADSELVRLPLEQIGDRPAGDTRPLNPEQVEQLLDSIRILGLIAPLAVDGRNRLLAGGHRRAALQRLAEIDLPGFNDLFPSGVPCRRFSFDAATELERALAVEIAENEKRRNYTKAEIRAVAERLKAQGYSQTPGPKNTPALTPALAVAFGVSKRTVERALKPDSESATAVADSPRLRSLKLPADLLELLEQKAASRGCTLIELLEVFVLED